MKLTIKTEHGTFVAENRIIKVIEEAINDGINIVKIDGEVVEIGSPFLDNDTKVVIIRKKGN